ncbi:MAG TPA: alpha/beta fold hydrolase [Candidatus Elarobacter sp.]|jgi:pimeloyl-ACP methyl ester carboxylesterase
MTRSLRTPESFGTDAAVPFAWRTRRIDAAGTTLAAFEAGSDASDAPAVLLLHGLGHWTDAAWGRLIPYLDPSLRYAGFDLPGFGASGKPDVRYDRAFFRRAVDDASAALGLRRFALLGHSLGGFIAADWAGEHPQRVTHLALVAPAGFSAPPRHLFYALLARAAGKPLTALAPSDRLVRRVLEHAVHDPSALDPAHVERAYALAQDAAVRRAFAGIYAAALETFTSTRRSRRRFARYTGPVLCAWGRHDRYIPPTTLDAVRSAYAGVSTLVLERSGHLPMLEEPESLAAPLRNFFRT